MLFLDRLTNGHPFFHTPIALDLVGEVDVDGLRTALQRLVQRHEILRTTVHLTAHGGTQRVHEAAEYAWREASIPVNDLTGPLPAEIITEITRVARERIALDVMPLLSCGLYRFGVERSLLLLRLHHIATDAWSLGLILRDLEAAHHDSVLPEPACFRDWALEQRSAEGGPQWRTDSDFWHAQLDGVDPVVEIPTDRARPDVARHEGAMVQSALGETTVARADALTKSLRLSPSAVYLGAWAGVVTGLARRSDVLVGVAFANRQPRYANTVGFFANQLPLRLTDPSASPIHAYLQTVTRTVVGAYEHASHPFEAMVRDGRITPGLSRNPLVQVGFNFTSDRAPRRPIQLGAALGQQLDLDLRTSRMDLVLGVRRQPGRATTVLWYDSDLYSERTAQDLLERFGTAVEDLIHRVRIL
ncbi:hypothetical protein G3I68_24505 [Streptomyces sp. SID13588]|nr:hypothetical protein [Streptomyces sp. SID13588]